MNRPWLRREGDRVYLEVHVQPGASRTGVAGIHDGRIKIRVAAPPVEGAANVILRRFLAKAFTVPRHGVLILRGETGRHKQIAIDSPGTMPGWLDGLGTA